MAREDRHYMNEPDIGSGEKTPGQRDVEADVHSVHGTLNPEPLDGRHYAHEIVEEQRYADQPPSAAEQHQRQTAFSEPASRILQSGTHLARATVARMQNGSYEAQVYVRLTREPDIAETYIPAGTFPTEDEAMFRNSLALVEDCGLTFLHVFPYSARNGTPAAKMPQVPGDVRKERAARLRAFRPRAR